MSFNSKQYLDHEERLLEPSIVVTGSQRRYTETSMAAKTHWLNSLTPEQREQLRQEYEYEQTKLKYQI